MKKLFIVNFLSAMLVVTCIIALVYAAVQQSYRSSANDPQLQIARDLSANIGNKDFVKNYISNSVDLNRSLAVFTCIYDAYGKPLCSSGLLNGQLPHLPSGVFDHAKSDGENSITWQPIPSVRIAAVVEHTSSPSFAYVLVGRSLKEVEAREYNLRMMAFVCWMICAVVVAAAAAIQFVFASNKTIS